MELEKRVTAPGTLRAIRADGDKPKLAGYAAVFNTLSEDLGWFREKIAPGAFARSLRENADVRALFNHDANQVLGRSKAHTLTLSEDADGLKVEIMPPDTVAGRDTVTLVERGDVSQMSFGFITRKDEWDHENMIRTLIDVDLFDVSVVTYPAYPDTSVAKRSVEVYQKQRAEWEQKAIVRSSKLRDLEIACKC